LKSAELLDYYRRRAAEYEEIYAKPERQADLAVLKREIPERLRGRRVLEIACGTGYWTALAAKTAASVLATDLAEEPMQIARAKTYPSGVVRFQFADAYALDASLGSFDAALAVFWWSHVPRRRLAGFVSSLHACLEPGARVILMDNRYIDGSSTPISEWDAEGNSFQLRRLADGGENRVLKNFPSEEELRRVLAAQATSLAYTALEYYWLVEYEARPRFT